MYYGWSDEGGEDGNWKERSELPNLLYAYDLVLCEELEEDLRVMI